MLCSLIRDGYVTDVIFRSCAHFAAAIFGDYVGGFLGLPREGLAWSMDPFDVRGMVFPWTILI